MVRPEISVVIPTIGRSTIQRTLETINRQTVQPKEVIIIKDLDLEGANKMRNEGAKAAKGRLLVFSDDDVFWETDAFEKLYEAIRFEPTAAYSYGWYEKDNDVRRFCDQDFDPDLLRTKNYISTMSMIWRREFPGFNEEVQRLQDWDLWLQLLEEGKHGVYCGGKIFRTPDPDGITTGSVSWTEAVAKIKELHPEVA